MCNQWQLKSKVKLTFILLTQLLINLKTVHRHFRIIKYLSRNTWVFPVVILKFLWLLYAFYMALYMITTSWLPLVYAGLCWIRDKPKGFSYSGFIIFFNLDLETWVWIHILNLFYCFKVWKILTAFQLGNYSFKRHASIYMYIYIYLYIF